MGKVDFKYYIPLDIIYSTTFYSLHFFDRISVRSTTVIRYNFHGTYNRW